MVNGIKEAFFKNPTSKEEEYFNLGFTFIDMNSKKEEVREATKFDDGKPRFSTVPKLAFREVSKVFTYGANKYGRFNYSGQMQCSRFTDAAVRHLTQFECGEDMDEIGTHHLANAIASLMMALDGILNNTVIDDRNKAYTNGKDNKETKESN